MNSIRSYRDLLNYFIWFYLLLLEDYEKDALQKEPVIATFIKWIRKTNLRMFYWQITLINRAIYLAISYLLAFCW